MDSPTAKIKIKKLEFMPVLIETSYRNGFFCFKGGINIKKLFTACLLAGVILMFITTSSYAQIEKWVARYDDPSHGNDEVTDIAVDCLDNVYVTGRSASIGTFGNYKYATIKYDTNGNQLWVARNEENEWYDCSAGMAVDALGNVYVTGESYLGIDPFFNSEYATIKYDSNGTQLWIAKFRGLATHRLGNNHNRPAGIATDQWGNIYVTGQGSIINYVNGFVTIKYDTNGNELWIATYNDAAPKALAVDASGNVYVTGYYSYGGDGYRYYKYITIKYDTNGNQLWLANYSGPIPGQHQPVGVAVDALENVYVTGYVNDIFPGPTNYATIKYDRNGNELWVNTYNGPGNSSDSPSGISLDPLGNIYVTGFSVGSSGGWGGRDYATIKYDTNGNQLWVARYDGPYNNFDFATAIAVDGSGNVYTTGVSVGIIKYSGGYYYGPIYTTIKYDTDGNQLWVETPNNAIANPYGTTCPYIALDTLGNPIIAMTDSVYENPDFVIIKYSANGILESKYKISKIIENMETLGTIAGGELESFITKLENAIRFVQDASTAYYEENNATKARNLLNAAQNMLKAFINEIQARINAGKIDREQGDKLTTLAKEAIALLEKMKQEFS